MQKCARLILTDTDSELPAWLLQFKLCSSILVPVSCQAIQADPEQGPGGVQYAEYAWYSA